MNSLPPEVNVPPLKSQSGHDEWRIHLYNQERMIAQGDQYLATLQVMATQMKANQQLVEKLNRYLDDLGDQMQASIKSMGEFNRAIIKVPIVLVIIGAASWAFLYAKAISENTWLIILAVATFPYLGDGITAIAKLFGIGRANQLEEKK